MSQTLEGRIKALEAMRPRQATEGEQPRWFIEAQKDSSVGELLRCAAVHGNAQAIDTLHERFGAEATQMIAEYGEVWRRVDEEC